MGVFLVALAVGLSAPAAEPPVAVSDLVSLLTSLLATDRNDKRIAHRLETIRVSERLSEETIGTLKQMGVGRATLRALDAIRKESAGLPAPSQDPLSVAPAPSDAEQAGMLDAMRRWSAAYLAGLPNFMCTRSVQRHRSIPPIHGNSSGMFADGEWFPAGSYSSQAGYSDEGDFYRVEFADGRPSDGFREGLAAEGTWGEFGGFMKEILDPNRQASFAWDRWEVYRARRMAVFRYAVDVKHSQYSIRTFAAQPVIVAHRGFVYVDPHSGAVGRLILYATGLKAAAPITALGSVLDYAETSIGGATFVLPRSATSYVRTDGGETHEAIEYRDYRKFHSDSTIRFDAR
jgi:hypothetical protein